MIKEKLKRTTLRTLLLLASILAISQSSFANLRTGGTVYVLAGNYNAPEVAIQFLGNSSNSSKIMMTEVTAGVYKAEIPTGNFTRCVILRGNSNDNGQDRGVMGNNPWNSTTIDLPDSSSDYDMATFDGWKDGVAKFHWATYNPYGLNKDVKIEGVNDKWEASDRISLIGGMTTYSTDIEITSVTNGRCYFRIVVDGTQYATGKNNDTQISLGSAVSLGSTTGNEGAWYFPASVGEKYTFTVNKDANSVTVTKAGDTPASAPTFRINWADKNTPTITSSSTSAPYSYSYTLEGYKSNNWMRIVGVSEPNTSVTYGPNADTNLKPEAISNFALTRTSQKILSVDTDGHTGNLTVNFTCAANGQVTITSVNFVSTQAPDPTEGVQFQLSATSGSNEGDFTKTHVSGNIYEYTLERTLTENWWMNLKKVDGSSTTYYSPNNNITVNSLPYTFSGFSTYSKADESHCFVFPTPVTVKISFLYDETSSNNQPYNFKIEAVGNNDPHPNGIYLKGKFNGGTNKSEKMTWNGNAIVPEYYYTVTDQALANGEVLFYVEVDGTKYYSVGEGDWTNIENVSYSKNIQQFEDQEMNSGQNALNRWRVTTANRYNITVHVRPEQNILWVSYDEKEVPYATLGLFGDKQILGSDYAYNSFDPAHPVVLTRPAGGGVITHKIVPTETGSYKFAFTTPTPNRYLLAANERLVTLSGVPYVEAGVDMNKTFTYNFKANHEYTLTVDGTNVKIEEKKMEVEVGGHVVKINGLDGTWGFGNYSQPATYDPVDDIYYVDYLCSNVSIGDNGQEQVRFRINVDAVEYAPEKNNVAIPLGNRQSYGHEGSDNYWWFNACQGGTFRIRVNLNNNTFRVLQLPCNHEGEVHMIAAITGLAQSWTANDLKLMSATTDKETNEAGTKTTTTTTYTRQHFPVSDKMTFRVRLGGVEYTPGTTQTLALGEWMDIATDDANVVDEKYFGQIESAQAEAGYYSVASKPGVRYIITVEHVVESELDPNAAAGVDNVISNKTLSYRIKVEAAGDEPLDIWAIPVVPERITDRFNAAEWAEKLTPEKPAVFLMANILNGERVNPEWEMIWNETTKKYELNGFVMRSTTDGNKAFVKIYTSVGDNNPAEKAHTDVKLNYGNAWTDQEKWTPGMLCNASYDPATETLEFKPVNNAYQAEKDGVIYSVPPFLAIVGSDFTTFSEDGLGYTTPRERNTEEGWQESRLLFDANGELVLDTRGRVMYSTLYPPKYPSFFEIEVEDEKIEERTTNVRFNSTVDEKGDMMIMTGEQWKNWLKANVSATAYENLINSTELNNNDLYARMVVKDVWVLGSFKLWTGWNGNSQATNNAKAEWDYHMNFGMGDEFGNNSGTEIELNTAYILPFNKGNIRYEDAQYFKTVEFFYNLKHEGKSMVDAGKDLSVLYTTQGFGQPSINARSVGNKHEKPTFELKVANMPDVAKVTSIEVIRYNAATDKPCSKTGTAVDAADAVVLSASGLDLDATNFNKLFRFDQETGTYVTVESDVANGRYMYMLNITFKNGQQTEQESVMSGVVTILKTTLTTRPRVYQLVENKDESLHFTTGKPEEMTKFDYITFSEEAGRKIYGLSYKRDEADTKYDYEGFIRYEEITSLNTDKKKQDYYLNPSRCGWTDKVFIFCELPTELKSMKEDEDYVIDPYELVQRSSNNLTVEVAEKLRKYSADNTSVWQGAQLPDMHNSYAAVITFKKLTASNNILSVRPNIWYLDSNKQKFDEPANYTARDVYFTYSFPVPEVTGQKYKILNEMNTSINATLAKDENDPDTKDEYINTKDYGHTFSIELPVSGVNVSGENDADAEEGETLFDRVYPYLEAKVQMVYGDDVRNLTNFYVTKRASSGDAPSTEVTGNSIVINNLDPNDFIELNKDGVLVAKDGVYVNIDANFPDNVNLNAYPAKPGFARFDLKPTVSVSAPPVSIQGQGHVYRRIVADPDVENTFYEELVLSHMRPMEHPANTIAGGALVSHKGMQVAMKSHKGLIGGSRTQSLNTMLSDNIHVVLERSEPFHWYAEMESDLKNAPRTSKHPSVDAAYMYFFTLGAKYEGNGIISFEKGVNKEDPTPQQAKMMAAGEHPRYNAAPKRKAAAGDTHSIFLSTYGSDTALPGDILTSVEGISMDLDVTAGYGWLEANGESVQVYNAAGMLVAGAGRSELPAGIYVVRVDGKTVKVAVK